MDYLKIAQLLSHALTPIMYKALQAPDFGFQKLYQSREVLLKIKVTLF
jgi:hypothetical protein